MGWRYLFTAVIDEEEHRQKHDVTQARTLTE